VRERHQGEPTKTGNYLAQKFASCGRGLGAHRCSECDQDPERRQHRVESDVRIPAVTELIRANQQIEAEREQARDDDTSRAE